MDAIQQHLLDTYRAARLSEPAPPPPGRHDRAVLRDLYRHWLTHPPVHRTADPGVSGPPDAASPSGG
ncbi:MULTISPECIES: hypothetical protein [unclassified Streptomyces]|uniref:hypothetical protein n=1 Tax=unclassified Streptomyces TaxID=2593676 RepID=UPI000934B014|nr:MULTISPECIES: hypothetical protein [unclassified Streptomyces]QWQ42834.1 hypothetical protein KME66_18965 [Streptomyces sp. YPW6]